MKKFYSLLLAFAGLLVISACDKKEHKITQNNSADSAEYVEQNATPEAIPTEATNTFPVVHAVEKLNAIKDLVVNNSLVVVDFYAPWCGPCKLMTPILEELSQERGDITFVKVDIDKLDSVFTPFEIGGKQVDISSVPTFYLFKNGVFVHELHGGMNKNQFIQKIDTAFKG